MEAVNMTDAVEQKDDLISMRRTEINPRPTPELKMVPIVLDFVITETPTDKEIQDVNFK